MTHRTPRVISVEGAEPVTVAEARAHLEAQAYEDSDADPLDDAMIEGFIVAAREYCEEFLGLSLVTKTLEIALDRFPVSTDLGGLPIELPGGPVRHIIQVVTQDTDDADVSAAEYVLDNYRRPNQIKPAGSAWPVITAATNAITIRYLAGYGVDSDGGDALPKMIRAGLLLMLGHLYANREATAEKALSEVPYGVECLLRPHRVRLGMA